MDRINDQTAMERFYKIVALMNKGSNTSELCYDSIVLALRLDDRSELPCTPLKIR